MNSLLPCVIHDYEFQKVIGHGGFSTVYLVENLKYKILFVAKVVSLSQCVNEQQDEKTFEDEVRTLKSLNHPHIIRLYDSFVDQTNFFMILEYCPYGSLMDEVTPTRPMSRERFLTLAPQIISALALCHSNSIAHRDIKLGNILLDKYGRAKLADFGISVINHTGKMIESFSGSIEYEAPEVINKTIHDPFKADIWSLGVLFAACLNGFAPWDHCDTLGKLKNFVNAGKYHLKSYIGKDLRDVISRMIVVEPDKRITIKELQELPIFQQQAVPDIEIGLEMKSVPDALSPRGRALLMKKDSTSTLLLLNSPIPLSSPNNNNNNNNNGGGNNNVIDNNKNRRRSRKSSSIDMSESCQSKALMICSLNIATGINQPPKLKPRLHQTFLDRMPGVIIDC